MSYSPIFFFLFGGEGVGISTPSSSLVHYFCKKKLLEAHFWHNSCLIIKKVCHPYQRLFNKICNWVTSLLKRQLSNSPFWTVLVVGECKTFYFCFNRRHQREFPTINSPSEFPRKYSKMSVELPCPLLL